MKQSPQKMDKKWQKIWEKERAGKTSDKIKGKKNYFLLVEFPYPSGNLHIGHWYAFALPDIFGRYLKMKGYNVCYPIGFDAFGLPAENAAIKKNINPKDWTDKNIKHMTNQLKSMGAAFDWSRNIKTIDPDYYKWNQWFFLKLWEKGLAYRKKTAANWCPSCKTVLANEQVVSGTCERCKSFVQQKEIEQWMMKTTAFSESLAEGLNDFDWPESTKLSQKNWIGKSEGAKINFRAPELKSEIEIFTTRPDTIFGATYLVLSPEHSLSQKISKEKMGSNHQSVSDYLKKTELKTELERQQTEKEKTGVFSGFEAINPASGKKIPIWIADYVLGHYGSGAIMAVPGHDQRDFSFAKTFDLPIIKVIEPYENQNLKTEYYEGEGRLVNSEGFNGSASDKIREKITLFCGGKKSINFRLRDWLISRQRYWGTPIPMVHCENCGYQPIPEKELPVLLPKLKDYLPDENGRSPLAKATKWKKTKCPKCGKPAERETDTMDTFVDSSWYFLRYADPKNKKCFADPKKIKNWLPVQMYVGGAEHNTMHLLYSRFFTKALKSLGLLPFDEPFLRRKNHGIILGPDSQKMSKSRGNVIDPDEEVKKYGADAVRIFLAFMGPYEQGGPWNNSGIGGSVRFLERIRKFYSLKNETNKKNPVIDRWLSKIAKKVSQEIEQFGFNTAISALMECFNAISEESEKNKISRSEKETFLKLLSPFAPHLTEELWRNLNHKKSIHKENWPKWKEKDLEEKTFSLIIQINGKLRDSIEVKKGIDSKEAEKIALASEKIKKIIGLDKPKKTIYIPDRLINIVI